MLKSIVRSNFVVNVTLVASGTVLAQVFTLLASPFVTRIYEPDVFGVLGAFNSILSICFPIAALSYPLAIVLPREDRDAIGLAKASLFIAVITSALAAFILAFSYELIGQLLEITDNSQILFFLPFAMLFSVFSAIATNLTVRHGLFTLQGTAIALNSLIINGLKIVLGLIAPYASILVGVTTIGHLTAATFLYLGLRRNRNCNSVKYEKTISLGKLETYIKVLKRFFDFPVYRTPQIVINSASQNMPILVLSSVFGVQAAGFYTLSKMVLTAPATLIGQSVSTVFYPRINKQVETEASGLYLLLKANAGLAILGSPIPSILVIFGPQLFAWVFGEDWFTAGEIASWLSIWVYISLIARPSVATIPVIQIQRWYLFFEIASVVIRVLSLLLGYWADQSMLSVVIAFVIANVILDLYLILAVMYYISKFQRNRTA